MTYQSKTLDARAFGLAAGTIAAVLTTVCALGLAFAPRATTSVASTLIHLDLGEMSRTLSWAAYFGSLLGWSIGAGLVSWSAAALYNRFAADRQVVASTQEAFSTR